MMDKEVEPPFSGLGITSIIIVPLSFKDYQIHTILDTS